MLAGVGVSLVTLVFRSLTKSVGVETSRLITLLIVLVLSVVAALAMRLIPESTWQEILTVLATAVAFYETVVKTVVMPAINKAKK